VRVLHLIEDLGPGGAERLLFVNLSRLDRKSFDGLVCHLYDRALHWRQPILDLGYPVLSLGMKSIRDLPQGVARLARILRHERVDVVHTHLYGANLVGRIAAAMRGVPVISSLHNPDYEPAAIRDNAALSPVKLRLLCWLDRASCRLARPEFVAVSQYVKRSAVQYLGIPESRTRVIYNPVDTDMFTRSADAGARTTRLRADLELDPTVPVILCVARLDPQKGLRYLIEAMPALLREVPGVVLMFAGDGPPAARSALVLLAEALQVGSQVRFLGVQADVRPYLELCDVFVLPSLYEGMGISLVEAMAMERACVATSTTAVPEVVTDGLSGFLVAPANPQALAAAITRLLQNPGLRARMGVEGRRIALERFDVSRNIGQLESVYSQVARYSPAA